VEAPPKLKSESRNLKLEHDAVQFLRPLRSLAAISLLIFPLVPGAVFLTDDLADSPFQTS
jgi:hypothetical protein